MVPPISCHQLTKHSCYLNVGDNSCVFCLMVYVLLEYLNRACIQMQLLLKYWMYVTLESDKENEELGWGRDVRKPKTELT